MQAIDTIALAIFAVFIPMTVLILICVGITIFKSEFENIGGGGTPSEERKSI